MKAQSAMRQETSPTFILELATGVAACSTMRLYQGKPLDTIIVGSEADWCIQAKGVAARHAAFHFDGVSFFIAALPREVVWVDNRRIGEDWERVAAPAAIAIGTALIQLSQFTPASPSKQDGRGESSAVLKLPAAPARSGEATLLEAKPTLFLNMDELLGEKPKPAPPVPAAKGRSVPPSVVVAPQPTQKSRRAITLPSVLRGQRISWKVVAPALLLLVGGAFLLLAPAGGEGARAVAQEKAAASAPSHAKASASVPARAEASARVEPKPAAVPEDVPLQPVALPEEAPAPAAARVAAASTKVASQDGNGRAASTPQKALTLQRRAIDALISGNAKEARELYAALVKEEPSNVAVREALRILRRAETDRAQGKDDARP
jgi:hypothetical protein